MTFFNRVNIAFFNRENIELFKKINDAPSLPVLYGSEQKPLRYPKTQRGGTGIYRPHQRRPIIIIIPDMFLLNGQKLNLETYEDLPSPQLVSRCLNIFNSDTQIVYILYYQVLGDVYLYVYYPNNIILLYDPVQDAEDSKSILETTLSHLRDVEIPHSFEGNTIQIPYINDYEIFYAVDKLLPGILDYEKLMGQKQIIDYPRIFRKFPKLSNFVFEDNITEIFDQLVTEADLYDILTDLIKNFIKDQEDSIDRKSLEQAYFNLGFILSSYDDEKMRESAIKYLLKAGDLPEAKRLRKMLFLDKIGASQDMDIEINLDYETLLKFAQLWISEKKK